MKIEFEDRNVTEDPEAMSDLQELGYHSTPVPIIGDEEIVGFDRDTITEALNLD